MAHEYKLKEMAEKIKILKETACQLKELSEGIQAVDRNTDRILSSVRLLELDVTDVVDILDTAD